MLRRPKRRVERAEQLGIELVRQGDVEWIGRALSVLDLRDGVAKRVDLLVELLGGGRRASPRGAEVGVTSIA